MLSTLLILILLTSMDGMQMYQHRGLQRQHHEKISNSNKMADETSEYESRDYKSPKLWKMLELKKVDIERSSNDKVILTRRHRSIPVSADSRSDLNNLENSNGISKADIIASTHPQETLSLAQSFDIVDKFWNANGTVESVREAQARLMKMIMDRTVDPCDNFYKYACGNWNKVHPMRNDQAFSSHGSALNDKLRIVLRKLIEEKKMVETLDSNDAEHKVTILYESCTNMEERSRVGVQPLLDIFNAWGGWPVLTENWNSTDFNWIMLTANIRLYVNWILLGQWVGPYGKNSSENIIQFRPSKLQLPVPKYYLKEEYVTKVEAYKRFMAGVMHKLGVEQTKAAATGQALIRFETQLARIIENISDSDSTRMTLRELKTRVPGIDLVRYLTIVQERRVNESEEVVVTPISYLMDLVKLINSTEPETVANYLFWRFFAHRLKNLDARFNDLKRNLNRELSGIEDNKENWVECISEVNSKMRMALGAMFVRKYFDENSKKEVLQMTKDIKEAFRENIETIDWLDAETKRLAELKLDYMSLLIGYPDYILQSDKLNAQLSYLKVYPDKYLENILSIIRHTAQVKQRMLNIPVDDTCWQEILVAINAFHDRGHNQMKILAGILQAPYYNRHLPKAITFSGIGTVIAHELVHGFDNEGQRYDHKGNVNNWWSNTSIEDFQERAQCIVEQYGNYTVGDLAVDGELTLGENIADNGGIRLAFQVYTNWLQDHPERISDERLPGLNLTAEQLFFLGFAQNQCSNMRREAVRDFLNYDSHAPAEYRVIGTLSNSEEFSEAYQCPKESPMNIRKKCKVW